MHQKKQQAPTKSAVQPEAPQNEQVLTQTPTEGSLIPPEPTLRAVEATNPPGEAVETAAGTTLLSGDVLSTLWIFYNKLKVQGRRTDLLTNVEKLPTWIEWMEAKLNFYSRTKGGVMLAEMDRQQVGRPKKLSHDATISEIGISKDQSSRWQQEAKIPEAELKLRAERKAGLLIPEQFPHGGDRKSTSYDKSLKEVGITYDQSSRWQLEAKIPEGIKYRVSRSLSNLRNVAKRISDFF
jgi:hypothetical protein